MKRERKKIIMIVYLLKRYQEIKSTQTYHFIKKNLILLVTINAFSTKEEKRWFSNVKQIKSFSIILMKTALW